MPEYDLAGNPLPEKETDQNSAEPPLTQRPLYAQATPVRYDMAGNPLPTPNPPAAAPATRYDFAGNPIDSAPPATPYYAAAPTANSTWPPPPSGAGYGRPMFVNTSGTQGDVPPEIARLHWNWGAFLMARWWCYRHGLRTIAIFLWVTLYLLRHALAFVSGGEIAAVLIAYVLLDYGLSAYLGFKGHELAWRNRRFESIEEYFKVQRAWLIGGVVWQIFWISLQVFAIYSIATMSHTL